MPISPAELHRLRQQIESGRKALEDKQRQRDGLRTEVNRMHQELAKKESGLKKLEIEIAAADRASQHDAHELLELERQIRDVQQKK